MPKKIPLRTLTDSKHVKGSESLLKSTRQYLCHIFWSLWKEVSSKIYFLVVSENLRLFVNKMTPDAKFSLSVKASVYLKQFKCNYLQIQKYFLNFFLHFLNLQKIFNTLKKKMSFRGYLFLES